MSAITFDRLAYMELLKSGGVPEAQARVHTTSLDSALHDTVATKADLMNLEIKIADMKTEIIKWFIGISFAQITILYGMMKAHG